MSKKKSVHDGSFAKLFGSGKDQVLIFCRDNDEGNPAIEVMISTGGGSTSIIHHYKEDAYDKRDETFASIDEPMAMRMSEPIRKAVAKLFTD
jgi:hypothetical protein